MSAAEKLTAMMVVFRRHEAIVQAETRTMSAAAALMAKHSESRLVDAVSREAKARACRELAATA